MDPQQQDRLLEKIGSGFRPAREAALQQAARLSPEELQPLLHRALQRTRKRNHVLHSILICLALIAGVPTYFMLWWLRGPDESFPVVLGDLAVIAIYYSLVARTLLSPWYRSSQDYVSHTVWDLCIATRDPRFFPQTLDRILMLVGSESERLAARHKLRVESGSFYTEKQINAETRGRRMTCAQKTLESLQVMLPEVTEEQYRALTENQVKALYGLLSPNQAEGNLIRLVLEVLGRMKETRALPAVKRAAARTDLDDMTRQAAETCRERLQAAVQEQAQQRTLLRASEGDPAVSAETLLIPAMSQPESTPQELLLRSSDAGG